MMFQKTVRNCLLVSIVVTSVLPTLSVAAPTRHGKKNHSQKQGNKQFAKKKYFWQNQSWENILFGGCILAGIGVALYTLLQKSKGNTFHANDAAIKNAGACAICLTNNIDMTTPCCNRTEDGICRTCWNKPVQSGDYEVEGETFSNKQRDTCPFCRADKVVAKNETCVIL